MPDLVQGRELTVAEIAEMTQARLAPGAPSERRIRNFAALGEAGSADISFLENEDQIGDLSDSEAGACLMPQRFAASAPPGVAVLATEEPYRALVVAARALFPDALPPASPREEVAAPAASALVHPSARIEPAVAINPFAVVGPRAEIGTGTVIGAGVSIGAGVCIGRRCVIGAAATVQHALIGDGVIIRPGARIGQDGIGGLPGPHGWLQIPRIRRVIVQDGVEIGANSTIDRGSLRDTVVGEGTKIDNLVQIAQDVRIGRYCLIGPGSILEGGATVGDFVVIPAGKRDRVVS